MAAQPLQGKIAIVTGAGSPTGIGHAIALGLIRAGARVALLDLNQAWLDQSVREMQSIGGKDCALGILTDVTNASAVAEAVQRTIAELGGLHIVVNNAGTNPRLEKLDTPGQRAGTNVWELAPEAWNRVVAVNLSGPFYLARAALGHLLAQGWGRIIGVTTSMDTMYRKGGAPYGPSKAGHEALVATLAQELEGTGVTANVLVPGGATNTNMIPPDTSYARDALIQPEVMQAPVVWLASEASNGFNNQRIIAHFWDERVPLEERLARASAPAAWPQLGKQAIFPR